MSNSGRTGSGRGNRRKRPFRRRGGDSAWQGNENSSQNNSERDGNYQKGSNRETAHFRGKKPPFFERPKWVPPKLNTDPLPTPDCHFCGKPIMDISQAISDRDSGAPVHFDCVTARIAGGEALEKDEAVTYIGGGRFGVVCFGEQDPNNKTGSGDFKIKKVIEWENKDKRAEWRSVICDHYSVT